MNLSCGNPCPWEVAPQHSTLWDQVGTGLLMMMSFYCEQDQSCVIRLWKNFSILYVQNILRNLQKIRGSQRRVNFLV